MKSLFRACSLIIGIMGFYSSAQAVTDNNLVIVHMGVASSYAYLNFTSSNATNGLSVACPAGNLYIDTTTALGQELLKIAIMARQSNNSISRVDYSQDASGNCQISLIEM